MRVCTLALLAALVSACSDNGVLEPVNGLTHVIATPSCGPADGPQVLIILAAEPFELPQPISAHVKVTVPVSYTSLEAGQVYDVSESFDDANAWRAEDLSTVFQAVDGEVGITSVSANAIAGYIDLEFPHRSRIRGSFNATWQPRQLLCG